MSIKAVVGLQWGDEGKGKIVDLFSSNSDLAIRYQGGNNAGHTVVIKDDKFIFHLIPSGILRKNLTCLITRGAVIAPEALLKEINILSSRDIDCKGRLFVSRYAHVVMPYHKILDGLMDKIRGDKSIGTTKRGIGPCYADKYYRCGIRMEDLLDENILKSKLKNNLELKNALINDYYREDEVKFGKMLEKCVNYGKELAPYIIDCQKIIKENLQKNKRILYEGAQGTLLDIDYGTYPYVTSSHPSSPGIFTAGEMFMGREIEIFGVMKAYTTRVGKGPFPTECKGEIDEKMRKIGKEYGASTGRPRRCGWFDAFALNYTCRINGVNKLVLTKLDVLDEFKRIKICTGYKYNDNMLENFPASTQVLREVEPVFEEHSGWECSTKEVKKYDELPTEAKSYIERIEELLEVEIDIISIGSKRSEIVKK